jgi:N-methylhydantoinase A
MAKHRVTVDTGGTFSDFVFFNEDSGEITITKVPSTPKEPFQAVLNGVKELIEQGVAAKDISFFCHGTTVGTNTLLEEKGAKTGLLVTQGFRGIYEVMEQTRGYGPATYDLFFEKPRLLAPPYYTEEIPERVDFRGNALKAIDVEASLEAVRKLKKKGVQSVAVCFLFSFLNPDHELKIKDIFAKEFPEARLSLSCEVLPQIREFYRLSTTVINAYPTRNGELPKPTGKSHARDGRHDAEALHHAIQRRRLDFQRIRRKTGCNRPLRAGWWRHRIYGVLRPRRD